MIKVTAQKIEDAREDGYAAWYTRSYCTHDGIKMKETLRLQNESDFTNDLYERFSVDNGKTWGEWKGVMDRSNATYGPHERMLPENVMVESACIWNPVHQHSLGLSMDRVFYNGHNAAYDGFWDKGVKNSYSDHTYLKITFPNGEKKIQLVQYETGEEFNSENPIAPEYYERNTGYCGTNVVVDDNGDVLFALCPSVAKCCELGGLNVEEIFPSAPHLMTGVLVVRGVWNGESYDFTASKPIVISDRLSSRGLIEVTVAKLKSGRIVVVCRGSNMQSESWNTRIEPGTPGFKWYSYSDDGGITFTEPAPWHFDTGEVIYSSATISFFLRGERNGKLYWIGNMTGPNVAGNFPRWPLNIVEIDETYGTAKKETCTVIDTIHEGESEQVQLSNFSLLQNRETGELELNVTRIGQFPNESVWKSEVWRYRIEFDA